MLSSELEERAERVLSTIKFSDIDSNFSSTTKECPICKKKGKLSIHGRLAKCWSANCVLNTVKDVIGYYRLQNGLGYMAALKELELKFNLVPTNELPNRSKFLEKCLDIYQDYLWSPKGKEALDYLLSRGFIKEALLANNIGFAPYNSCLRDKGLLAKELQDQGLLSEGKEYYSNRIIFPIRNLRGHLLHFTGRYLGTPPKDDNGDDLLPRYKESRNVTGIPSSKSILAFENLLDVFAKSSDTLIITEGIPDGLTLVQLGIPTVSCLGLEKLNSHYSKFSRFRNLIFVFDNDTYPSSHTKYPLEYKSWVRILPQLIDLQIALPSVNFYVYIVPSSTNGKPTKDINDWVTNSNLTSSGIKKHIENNKRELCANLISKWGGDLNRHPILLRLIGSTNKLDLKGEIRKYIDPNIDPVDYALRLVAA